ncbi:MAG TPA: helix-turn-helix domain-containing protein [Cellvibrio sp.]|nr:helix-turn-helix domain-containing protein [Cellvibrio sp.]
MNKCEIILAATLKLLATKGFHGFSIRDVAKEAGIATGTLYLYFDDREDLINKLHGQIISRVAAELRTTYQGGLVLQHQFENLARTFWQLFMREPDILLSKGQFDHLPPDLLRSSQEAAKQELTPLFDFFTQGRASAELKDLPDDILFSLGFEPIFEIARKKLLGLIDVDEVMLGKIIGASWAALSK